MPRLSMNEKVNLISFDRELMNEKVSKSIMLNLNSIVTTIRNLKLDAITHAKVEKAINMLEELTYKLVQTDVHRKNSNHHTIQVHGIIVLQRRRTEVASPFDRQKSDELRRCLHCRRPAAEMDESKFRHLAEMRRPPQEQQGC